MVIDVIGTGPVQTGLVVALAVSAAVAIRGSGAIITQAASTAVLLGTLSPLHQHLAVPRTLNALIGGLTAVFVALLLLPLNPVRIIHRAAGTTLNILGNELSTAATAMAQHDAQQLEAALRRLNDLEGVKQQGFEVVSAALEVAALSPWRRKRRAVIHRYRAAAQHLDRAHISSRAVVRWSLRALRGGDPIADVDGVPETGDSAAAPGLPRGKRPGT